MMNRIGKELIGSLGGILLLIGACQNPANESTADSTTKQPPLFRMVEASESGIAFNNELIYNEKFNIYTYRNFYNGGGVGFGDFDRDGLLDIYFTANMQPNRLYRNQGDFRFEDITEKAGVAGERAWSTGVSVADVNGDGWLDIYVCNSGDLEGDNKQNELFINNGDLTFTEQAQAYGVADKGFSTHAAFFDYDRDGDLDLYLLNNSYQAIGSFNLRKNMRPQRDSVGGDKLLRNDGESFTDVSEEAGIYGSVIGFGLGVTVGDVNGDGWPDIYVSNDFFERDYLYLNEQDGTFAEVLTEQIRSISGASMGADMADINNDGHADIFVTEMLPGKNKRLKTKTTFENWDKYQYNLKNGYYHQFTRNMLHLNHGDDRFSEIGRLAGVEATDWSWGAMIVDLDNDGRKDIFVANGIFQDLTDQDYINFVSNEETMKSIIQGDGVDFQRLIDSIPSEAISNYAFHNEGGLRFTDRAAEWGLDTPSFSNGSAYGDLDNDGDLDLVVNNINMPAFVYENQTNSSQQRYLKVVLEGEGKNPFGVGTRLQIRHQGQQFYLEQVPVRGFESTVDFRPNFGLGNLEQIDTLLITWPDDRQEVLTQVATNQTLTIAQRNAQELGIPLYPKTPTKTIFQADNLAQRIDYQHQENQFVDFDVDRLIYHMLSTEGPRMAKGDVNGDGLEDLYLCGARDMSGKLFVQRAGGRFASINEDLFAADLKAEDTDALFFDADGDGDQDLYVTSGGNEFSSASSALKDRLYFNQGDGTMVKSEQLLPANRFESSSCVEAADFDQDGDLDLFIGIRVHLRYYGRSANGYLLENDGKGTFKNVTRERAPELKELGMITDVKWFDHGQDGDLDLLVTGEWMPLSVFVNDQGQFTNQTEALGLAQASGWWNCVKAADFDRDGDMDFVVGNHGLNSRFRATENQPVELHLSDFDKNGSVEQIISTYEGGEAYPMVLRHDLVMQIPKLKKKYLKYESYRDEQIDDIFTAEQLEGAIVKKAQRLESSLLIAQDDGSFEIVALPTEAQVAPVYGLLIDDFDGDEHLDIMLGGNLHGAKPEVGRYDASYGLLLRGDGRNQFTPVSASTSGIKLDGEVRDILQLDINGQRYLLIARNNDHLLSYRY